MFHQNLETTIYILPTKIFDFSQIKVILSQQIYPLYCWSWLPSTKTFSNICLSLLNYLPVLSGESSWWVWKKPFTRGKRNRQSRSASTLISQLTHPNPEKIRIIFRNSLAVVPFIDISCERLRKTTLSLIAFPKYFHLFHVTIELIISVPTSMCSIPRLCGAVYWCNRSFN